MKAKRITVMDHTTPQKPPRKRYASKHAALRNRTNYTYERLTLLSGKLEKMGMFTDAETVDAAQRHILKLERSNRAAQKLFKNMVRPGAPPLGSFLPKSK
jgi:hypothetical protein